MASHLQDIIDNLNKFFVARSTAQEYSSAVMKENEELNIRLEEADAKTRVAEAKVASLESRVQLMEETEMARSQLNDMF